MKLKTLTITISSTAEFLADIKGSLKAAQSSRKKAETLSFDTMETFKRVLTQNRLEILMAIARNRPESIYQLAKFLDREHPHVMKDCKALETFGFILLTEAGTVKKQYTPKLSFEYDLIRVNSKLEEYFSISAKSNKVLAKAIA